jgi:hypothetical protein
VNIISTFLIRTIFITGKIDLPPTSNKKMILKPKEAGFRLLIELDEGNAIPEDPMEALDPKSESYKLPSP